MSVRMEQLGCHWMAFHKIVCLSIFRKSVEEIQVLLKSGKNNRVLYMKTYVHNDTISLNFFRMGNVSDEYCR
jgi:hypothetical protein